MPWFKACLCRREKRKPRISPPLHLLLQDGGIQNHSFRAKAVRKPRPCHVCHQLIHTRGSVCRVCKYVCHPACESKVLYCLVNSGASKRGPSLDYVIKWLEHEGKMNSKEITEDFAEPRYGDTSLLIHNKWRVGKLPSFPTEDLVEALALSDTHSVHSNDGSIQSTTRKKSMSILTTTPRSSVKPQRDRKTVMDLTYVTERIIALWFPNGGNKQSFWQGHHQAAHMLGTKHSDNYMIFNLSEPRRAIRSQHGRVRELGWPSGLAPPLEKLCSICKDIETWLSGSSNRIAVLHARGSCERIGVVVAAFMHYSSICGTADQALDRFAMRRYLDDKVGDFEQPSHRRYVDYFSGLLSGNIRVNSAPLYLTHVTVLGAPTFESGIDGVACRAFLKIYEGLVPVYTSGVHRVSPGCRQFTVNVAADRGRQGLQLHGDILVKCYHRLPQTRELVFACQFHTCAITDHTLSLTRHELDGAIQDLRFPLDGAVELHFSPSPTPRQPAPAPTPAVPVESADDTVVRWDSYADLERDGESDTDGNEDSPEVSHTYGPLDGSIYATVAKKASPVGQEPAVVTSIGSPRTVSMDSGISSAGNGLQNHTNASNASSTSPAPATGSVDSHRALDELLREMLVTVENIPDVVPPTLTRSSSLAAPRGSPTPALEHIAFIDDPEEIPYHARTDSRPFTYGAAPGPEMLRGQTGLSSPSLVRKASFGKSNGYVDHSWTTKSPKSADSWTSRTSESSWSTTPRNTTRSWDTNTSTTPRTPRAWDTNSSTDSYRWRQTASPGPRKSYDSHDGITNGGLANGNMTWLQRQQQKLRERRDATLRAERRHQEVRLISELRSHNRPSASHRDGYTSDTTQFADEDDDDLTLPLHVQTALSSPARTGNASERPFVAVKRAHEQNRQKQFMDSSPTSPSEPGLLSLARGTVTDFLTKPKDDSRDITESVQTNGSTSYSQDALTALIATLGQQRTGRDTPDLCNSNLTNSVTWPVQLRDDSVSSWRTASMSDEPGSPSRTNSPRPVTPAFPVHPRTPYSNSSSSTVHFELNGLPPKSPTAQRRGVKTVRRSNSSSSKDRSPSPNGIEATLQHSPKSTTSSMNGGSGGSYQPASQRSSIHSGSEPPQDVPAAQVKFVKDTSRFWYKPTITREEAINMLRNESPGTFVVRDSNSFPGAFGLAVKVATPPPGKTGAGPDELVRHFLIEPTSRGVRLKGCANEPVFSTLSALVYQHSITNMALPTRLVLPQGDKRIEPSHSTSSTAQQLLAQGAACNVFYLVTVDMESLTGPQAIRKAVEKLFHTRPLPVATIVHFKVSGQGITLTDNKRQLFFRRHYPVAAISYCGLDPEDHRWSHSSDSSGVPISSNRCFGFVARKPASKTDNQCHVFAELEPEQPATAIVNFVTKVMMGSNSNKPNIV